jgi:phosphoribosyl 1,2-cyclic phosphodiesterase
MEICVLGSGSSGNCTVVRTGRSAILIDAGLGPRTVKNRIAELGIKLADIQAILLTHLDTDHFRPTWFRAMLDGQIKLLCHRRHVKELYEHRVTEPGELDARALHRAGLLEVIDDRPFTLSLRHASALAVTPLNLAHDREGTVGFRIDAGSASLGFATDLGRVPPKLIDLFTDVDLLALESNYDEPMQLASPRPAMLKNRIMGGSGHLSNHQAFEAICRIIQRSTRLPRHVVLLHLSRQCNCPAIVRSLFAQHPILTSRLCLSHATVPTPWLSAFDTHQPSAGEQFRMFG